ncbi:hypothetical protein [Actinacidiphila glaucinigra]|uniref:hypothetical protein n=1 Tax=Actinacidiphila glaucinigra TaxID=235986 RepID=UPI00371F9F87
MPSKLAIALAEATRAQQTQPTPSHLKAQEVSALFRQGIKELRGNRHMHPDRKRVEAAQLYTNTRAALAKMKRDHAEQDNTTFANLERKLWGYDTERAMAADRASFDAGIRDAQDRASKLTKADKAARALHDAEQAGDHILARAVAKRAHDMDWGDVVHDYLATRPSTADTYQQAGEIWHRHNDTGGQMQNGMHYVVHKPEELRGMTDQDIARLADPEPADAA